MNRGEHIRDPISGEDWFFGSANKRNRRDAKLYRELAVRHGLTFQEINQMVTLALRVIDDDVPALEELKTDAARLSGDDLAIEELLQIRERARRAIELCAERETDPVKRLRLEALLLPTETGKRIEEERIEI